MKQYLEVVRHVLENGTRKENRTAVDTLSTFNVNYEVDLRDGFPLLTTKRVSWTNIVAENLWFLSGSSRADDLERHGCKFWRPWTDDAGNVRSDYGPAWRRFPTHGVRDSSDIRVDGDPCLAFNDQIGWVLRELRRNQMSRRLVVSAWSPGEAQSSGLPPCHLLFVFNVQLTPDGERILCLHLTQRSCDVALGLPYNVAGYAFLLELFAKLSGMRAGIFAHTLVDAHIYTAKPDGSMADHDHVPGLREQLARTPRTLSKLTIADSINELSDIDRLTQHGSTADLLEAFKLTGYDPYPAIQFKVAV